jgi:HK97 family phage major capsid protein
MTTPTPPAWDYAGVIPIEFSTQIIEEAIQQSAVLSLGQRLPMGTHIASMPVPKTLPKASWVSAPGGRKPYTELALETQTIQAEEVAAVTSIPDVYLEDSSINLWAWVRPRLAEAIAVALDDAVLFGVNAPASFPAGGLISNTYSTAATAGADAVATVNNAMGIVEAGGLNVSGHAADLTVKGALRGVRDTTGAFLMGVAQVGDRQVNTLYGVPISYQSFSVLNPDYFTGAGSALLIGVRSDSRYNMDPSAVIADDTGAVVVSGWQDNVTPLKVWARFGCTVVKPVTVRSPSGAIPFARANLSTVGAAAREGQSASGGSSRKS